MTHSLAWLPKGKMRRNLNLAAGAGGPAAASRGLLSPPRYLEVPESRHLGVPQALQSPPRYLKVPRVTGQGAKTALAPDI